MSAFTFDHRVLCAGARAAASRDDVYRDVYRRVVNEIRGIVVAELGEFNITVAVLESASFADTFERILLRVAALADAVPHAVAADLGSGDAALHADAAATSLERGHRHAAEILSIYFASLKTAAAMHALLTQVDAVCKGARSSVFGSALLVHAQQTAHAACADVTARCAIGTPPDDALLGVYRIIAECGRSYPQLTELVAKLCVGAARAICDVACAPACEDTRRRLRVIRLCAAASPPGEAAAVFHVCASRLIDAAADAAAAEMVARYTDAAVGTARADAPWERAMDGARYVHADAPVKGDADADADAEEHGRWVTAAAARLAFDVAEQNAWAVGALDPTDADAAVRAAHATLVAIDRRVAATWRAVDRPVPGVRAWLAQEAHSLALLLGGTAIETAQFARTALRVEMQQWM